MKSSTQALRFVELTGLQDDLLLPWLDLYETAFPAAERVLVSKHLLALKGTPDEPGEHHLLAAVAGDASFAGLARYQVLPELGAAYLWYLATIAEVRNLGVGTKFYQEIVRRLSSQAVGVLVIEVEIPGPAGAGEGSNIAAERALAERRINFYRRQGARLLEGIHGSASKSNENAAKNQSKASGQMGQGKQGEAQKSQEDAEQDLQDVLDNLNQLEQQMQQQQNKEKLFQIEQKLKQMLEIQTGLQKRTADAEKLPEGRPKKLTVIKLFENQRDLSDSTKVIVKMLEDAPVFQFVLENAVEDMVEAATRLDKDNCGTGTQDIQDDAAKKISDLIEALRKERTKAPPKPGGGGGGGGGKQPLVPSLAQLKMLLIMQKNVNRTTKALDAEISKSPNPDMNKDQKERLRRAAELEGKISRLTEKTAKELEGQGGPPPGPNGNGGN